MIYALVHYPSVDARRIQLLRRKYDPQFDLIGPHLTLMFPVPESVGEGNLVRHLRRTRIVWSKEFSLSSRGVN